MRSILPRRAACTLAAAVLASTLLAVGTFAPARAQQGDEVAAPKGDPLIKRTLALAATFVDKGEQIRSGIHWRVFRAKTDASGEMPIAAESAAATPVFNLEPGVYVVHAAYGLAAATRRVEIAEHPASETLILQAGALKVEASIGDQPIPAAKLTSRIAAIMPSGEHRLIAENVPADKTVRLPEGRYFVESTYGESNAIVSAEIAIKAGQLTNATFHHSAATQTLKLVNQAGGEALANTAWSVLTPGGDVIRELIGAFPSMILAEGNYTVVARHDGHVYTREFEVKSGKDQDVEVVAK